jgi:hypothetical protein
MFCIFALVILHAKRVCLIVICDLPVCTVHDFWEKVVECKICVLIFYLKIA